MKMSHFGWLVHITSGLLLLFGAGKAGAADPENEQSDQRQTLIHDGVKRSYVVYNGVRNNNELVPGMQPTPQASVQKVPLVLVLHGGGGNAENVADMTGFSDKARQEGFIVVYPEGSGRLRNKLLTWNAGHCCGYAMENRVDDVGFMAALIEKLSRDYPVDRARVYATGLSNGGMMTHRLGIELGDRLAAVAPVIATLFGDEKKPSLPVPALMINGMLDKSVPHLGGPPGGRFRDAWDGTPALPAMEQATFWAAVNGCHGQNSTDPDDNPAKLESRTVIHWQYTCPANLSVESYLVKDSGHAWPGGKKGSRRGDDPGMSLNATDLVWEFFKRHAKMGDREN
jgi:polyhydroxybutyrate depolymerase